MTNFQPPPIEPLLEWWFQALNEPVGIILKTSDRTRLTAKLYAARAAHSNPQELAGLSIAMSPTALDELWIIHQIIKVEDAGE